jgi:hypothetical protein
VELTAILVYSAGTVTLATFCSLLFANTKVDLFGSQYKMMSQSSSTQSLIVSIVVFFVILLACLIYGIFSESITMGFMYIAGGVSILGHKWWFNYLYRGFFHNRYEKMELFRMQ